MATLPVSPSLDQLKRQAKELRKSIRSDDVQKAAEAISRAKLVPRLADLSSEEVQAAGLSQADALYAIARDHGFISWPRLKRHVDESDGVEADVHDLRRKWAQGNESSRKELMNGHHSLDRFEKLDPASDELSDGDARIPLD